MTHRHEFVTLKLDNALFPVQGERVRLKPMMKLIGNMHGNEAVGREMLLALTAYLLENFSTDQRVRDIVSRTDIHIMPSLNPDGRLSIKARVVQSRCGILMLKCCNVGCHKDTAHGTQSPLLGS